MRCAICVLRVPEFDAIVRALRAVDGIRISELADYIVAEADGDIVLARTATGVAQAVWFGALTGGVTGTIVQYTEDSLHLTP